MFTRLISPDGEEVLVTASGVEAFKKAGYTEPKPAKQSKAAKAADGDGEQDAE